MSEDYQRIGLFGRSKSGKSTMMDRILRGKRRAILFDHLDERAENAQREGYTEIRSMDELQDRVDRDYATGFRFWFHPHYKDNLPVHLSNLSDYLLDIQTQEAELRGKENRPGIWFAVDELKRSAPNQIMKKGEDNFSLMCSEGRHKGIHLVGATQRIAEVTTKFRGQLEKRYFFSQGESADLETIKLIGGLDGKQLAEEVRKLKPLEYVRMENAQYSRGKLVF